MGWGGEVSYASRLVEGPHRQERSFRLLYDAEECGLSESTSGDFL